MADIEIKDNRHQTFDELQRAIETALEECGLVAESYAKTLCPVDTGLLRNSITHTKKGNSEYIGSDIFYASFQEIGTFNIIGKHFLQKAVADHAEEYKKILEKHLK